MQRAAPFSYRVRVSNRARYARLQIDARDGLVVVVPRRFDQARVPGLVAERAEWVARNLERFGLSEARPVELPDELALLAIGERWSVEYRTPRSERSTLTTRKEQLVVGAPTPEAAMDTLGRFVASRARTALGPELHRLAATRGRRVHSLSVRNQRTRWGSCSARGSISLNRNLVFLPEELAETVLLHELCHLDELNHSARFWRLLAEAVPDLAAKRTALRDGWSYVPTWAR
jgi:predicted metal-dependent hydrolase